MTDETFDVPEDGDLYTTNHVHLYVVGEHNRKPALVVRDVNRFNAEVKAYMKHENFWPNVWFISDHGNAHLIDLTT